MARALAESNEPQPMGEELELWRARMVSLLQPEEEFRAGVPHERVALRKWLFTETGTTGRQRDRVLKLLCDGYQFPFVGTAEHLHRTQPKHRRKREQVLNMLMGLTTHGLVPSGHSTRMLALRPASTSALKTCPAPPAPTGG